MSVVEYITIAETAKKWGISKRRIQTLCNQCRIEGALRFGGKVWAIPIYADKPCDARVKSGKYMKHKEK